MDARRLLIGAALFTAPALCGCDWLNARPTAHPTKQPEPEPEDPPIVVQAPPAVEEPPADALASDEGMPVDVAEYIARVDDLATRVSPRRDERTRTARPPQSREPSSAISATAARAPSRNSLPAEERENTEIEDAANESVRPATEPLSPPVAPRLSGVAVRGASSDDAQRSASTQSEVAPEINAAVASRTAPARDIKALIDALPPAGENPSFRQQLDHRVAQVVAGEYDAAREPLTLVTNEQQSLASRFIDALIAVRDGHLGDPSAANSAALQAIEQLGDELRRASDLRLPTLAICSAVSGYGQYQPIEPPVFQSGAEAEFVLYVEVRDFVSEKQDDGTYQTRFDLRTSVLNRSGDAAVHYDDTDVTDRCRTRRSDCFIPRLVRLPATLSPGEYVVKVSVTDKLGKKVAENRATIRIAASR